MMQYLTVENLTLALVLLLALEKILRRLAPLTGTTRDDDLVARIDQAKAWVTENAPLIWSIVEDLAGTGLFPKAAKAQEFGRRLIAEWEKAHPGKALPPEAQAAADLVARGLSAGEHLTRPTAIVSTVEPAPAPGNPPPAPASI